MRKITFSFFAVLLCLVMASCAGEDGKDTSLAGGVADSDHHDDAGDSAKEPGGGSNDVGDSAGSGDSNGEVGKSPEESANHAVEQFATVLNHIRVPDMDASILDADEETQLQWLASLYEFEVNTMQSKTTDLSAEELQLVREHLSQVYGDQETENLIQGFYDEQDGTYYVPDGSWFTYNGRWTSASLTVTERSDDAAVLKLTGEDDYGGDRREIDFYLDIHNGRLVLQQRVII